MSRIDDLIAEHCPTGVAYRALGDLMEFAKRRVDPDGLDGSTYVGVDNLIPNFGGRKDSGYSANSSGAIAFQKDDILIGNIRPYLKKVWLADRAGGASPDVLTLTYRDGTRDALVSKFLYYAIASDPFIDYSMRHAKGAKMPRGDKAATLRYKIPVPPLAIQREIVAILDKMKSLKAELEAELEAELDLRGRQYAFYRDHLLSFREAEGVRWATLGELYESSSGLSKSADQFGSGHPFLAYKDVFDNPVVPSELSGLVNTTDAEQARYSIRAGDVFVTRTSEDLAGLGMSCAALRDFPRATFNGFSKRLRPKEVGVIEPSYAAYFFRSVHFSAQIARTAVLSTRVSLNDDILLRIRIAVPSLEEQRRIVATLDKFDALVNDLSTGLPAEIAARQKQYEYYRDKLLTFEEAA